MKNKIIFGLAFAVCLSFGITTQSFAKGDAKSGKKVYEANCVTCHGMAGKGDGPVGSALTPKPNNFTKGVFKYGSKDQDLAKTIKNGKGVMPPWGGSLSAKDIDDVISYIRTFKK